MNKQSIPSAFMTFLKDLPKAAFICHASMVGSIGIFFLVGKTFAKYLALTGNLQTAGSVIATELIILWLVAFALAVKIRPVRQEEFCQYPPINMLGGAFAVSIFFGLALGTISGNMIGFGIFKSILYTFPSMLLLLSIVVTTGFCIFFQKRAAFLDWK